MNCPQCGKPVAPGAQFCSGCGLNFGSAQPGQRKGMNTAAVVALVVAVVFIGIAFFGILIAIAVPGFVKARQEARKRACMENLQKIDSAKQQFALDANKPGDYEPTWGDLVNSAKRGYLPRQPICPAGGTYAINPVDEFPECSLRREGHALP